MRFGFLFIAEIFSLPKFQLVASQNVGAVRNGAATGRYHLILKGRGTVFFPTQRDVKCLLAIGVVVGNERLSWGNTAAGRVEGGTIIGLVAETRKTIFSPKPYLLGTAVLISHMECDLRHVAVIAVAVARWCAAFR